MSDQLVHCTIGAVSVSVRSDRSLFLDEFLSLYAPYRCESVPETSLEVVVQSRKRYPWQRSRYTVRGHQEHAFDVRRRSEVLPHMEWMINWQVIRHRDDFVQLHAATVVCDRKALILAGDPGSGKSTLTAGMLARGWSYLCDEFALIDPQTLDTHPFPRALCMKEPSFPVIDRLGLRLQRKTPYHKPTKGRVAFLDPLDVRPDVVAEPAPVGWVVFPRYVKGARPALEPIARAEAAYDLAKQCFNLQKHGGRALEVLAALVRDAACYRLVSGDIEETCDLLEDMSRSHALPRGPRVAVTLDTSTGRPPSPRPAVGPCLSTA